MCVQPKGRWIAPIPRRVARRCRISGPPCCHRMNFGLLDFSILGEGVTRGPSGLQRKPRIRWVHSGFGHFPALLGGLVSPAPFVGYAIRRVLQIVIKTFLCPLVWIQYGARKNPCCHDSYRFRCLKREKTAVRLDSACEECFEMPCSMKPGLSVSSVQELAFHRSRQKTS